MDTLLAAVAAAILSLLPQWKSEAKQQRAEDYAQIIVEESQAVQPTVDPFLVVAIIFRESSFRALLRHAKERSPWHARRLNVRTCRPCARLRAGCPPHMPRCSLSGAAR